ncbi:MAG: pyridoxal phosphate-dependent aminotransferase, partial [Pseudobdellovibrionaceae bacterium]
TQELREAIVKQMKNDFGWNYSAKEVTVGSGAKFIIFTALQVLCDPGDEVIFQAPFWVSYPAMIELAGGVSKVIPSNKEGRFKIAAAQLENAITPKTKAFLYCSPSNPTGEIYSKEELKAIADVLRKHPKIAILSDDIYNRLVFEGGKLAPHILEVAPDLRDRTLSINGVSKSYSMTGWRIGWAVGPENLIKPMGDFQSQATGAPSSISQRAAWAAIEKCDEDIAGASKMLKERRDFAVERLRKIKDLSLDTPPGAFYLWVDISKVLGRKFKGEVVKDSRDFSKILLEQFFVAVVPGFEFGVEGYMRLSFAIENKRMAEAIDRIGNFISHMT